MLPPPIAVPCPLSNDHSTPEMIFAKWVDMTDRPPGRAQIPRALTYHYEVTICPHTPLRVGMMVRLYLLSSEVYHTGHSTAQFDYCAKRYDAYDTDIEGTLERMVRMDYATATFELKNHRAWSPVRYAHITIPRAQSSKVRTVVDDECSRLEPYPRPLELEWDVAIKYGELITFPGSYTPARTMDSELLNAIREKAKAAAREDMRWSRRYGTTSRPKANQKLTTRRSRTEDRILSEGDGRLAVAVQPMFIAKLHEVLAVGMAGKVSCGVPDVWRSPAIPSRHGTSNFLR